MSAVRVINRWNKCDNDNSYLTGTESWKGGVVYEWTESIHSAARDDMVVDRTGRGELVTDDEPLRGEDPPRSLKNEKLE